MSGEGEVFFFVAALIVAVVFGFGRWEVAVKAAAGRRIDAMVKMKMLRMSRATLRRHRPHIGHDGRVRPSRKRGSIDDEECISTIIS